MVLMSFSLIDCQNLIEGLKLLQSGQNKVEAKFSDAELKKAIKTINRIIYASGDWKNGTNNLGEGFNDKTLNFTQWSDLVEICRSAKIMLQEVKYTPLAVVVKTSKSIMLLKSFVPKSIRVITAYTKADGGNVKTNPEIISLTELNMILKHF
jgi:hypothetical protein